MKARRRARLDTRSVQELVDGWWESLSIGKYSVPIWLWRCKMAMSRGRELARV